MSALRPPPSSRPFVPRTDAELSELPDDELVAYVARAKKSKAEEHARTAMFLLLYRHEKRMRGKVRARLPAFLSHHSETIEEWVLANVWESALKLPLKGDSPGEWTNWWKQVVTRQVVSFWRSKQGQALEKEIEWPDQRAGGDEGSNGEDTVGADFDIDALALSLDYRAAIGTALDTLSEKHRAIVQEAYLADRPSKDVGAEFDETYDNVDQIKKRFRDALRAELVARGVWES
ncbi:MAG: sigma factor-like helix-turn-helix DNA-binding protein [Solirubrobacteraceae bacterium]